tara:strand:- start:556 stop:660 length:105 start_codon:yes stop_codon:yes gene_type:complete
MVSDEIEIDMKSMNKKFTFFDKDFTKQAVFKYFL